MQGPPQHRVLSSAPQCSATGAGVPRWEQCLGGGDDTREQQALPWPEEPLQQLHGARYGGGGEGALSGGLTGGGWPWPGPVTPHSALPAWLCPENAACAPDGPGLVQCLCDSPFHGYKCLREVSAYRTGPPLPTPPPARARAAWAGGGVGAAPLTAASSQGTFPVLLFCGILGAITLSLSLLLWGTQRRKAKTP